MGINQIIWSLKWFLGPALIFGLVTLFFTARYGLADTQLWFNRYYSNFLDGLMPMYTYLGDGLIFLFMLPVFLLFKRQALVALIFGALLTLLFTASLKSYFDEPRPLRYFEEEQNLALRQVPGVKAHYNRSFPSGHTTAAFVAWGILAFYARRKDLQLFFFLIALGVAYSRIYLNLHFLRDVGAGAILGSFLAMTAIYLSGKIKRPWVQQKWLASKNEVLR